MNSEVDFDALLNEIIYGETRPMAGEGHSEDSENYVFPPLLVRTISETSSEGEHLQPEARVLVGFQVPHGDRRALARFFAEMARRHSIYSYWDETENPAYQMFLR